MKDISWPLAILPQPTETTCGPTCLHGLYSFLGANVDLDSLIKEMTYVDGGGTLGVHLGSDALMKGFDVTIFTHNLQVFDPTWFKLDKEQLKKKLELQSIGPKNVKTRKSSEAYVQFLDFGGKIAFEELTPEFLYRELTERGPMICGLSATYLYQSAREIGDTCDYDDLYGEPQGHFVVLGGMDQSLRHVDVYDPLEQNPIRPGTRYRVLTSRLINSILIGVITYDANILAITKREL